MKREGRQHGMVRTFQILPSPLNPRPNTRIVNPVNSPATAGIFSKVSSKPTNHSKFTGKCEKARCSGCHLHPVSKSKDKIKGNHKVKSDVALNYKVGGYSSARFLHDLAEDHDTFDDFDQYDSVKPNFDFNSNLDEMMGIDREENESIEPVSHHQIDNLNQDVLVESARFLHDLATDHDTCDDYEYDSNSKPNFDFNSNFDEMKGIDREENEIIEPTSNHQIDSLNQDVLVEVDTDCHDDGESLGFYDVAVVWDSVDDDEGWSLVGGET